MGKPTQAGTEVTQSQGKNRMPRKHFWLLVSMTIQPTTNKIGGPGIGT